MKYRVIVYRSRKLKKNTIITSDGEAAEDPAALSDEEGFMRMDDDDEPEVRMSRKQRKAQKKEMKKSRHLMKIGDEEVDPRDYDPEELDDLKANAEMNTDGFYDVLEPIDLGEMHQKQKIDKKKIFILIPLIGVMVAAIYFGVIRMFF